MVFSPKVLTFEDKKTTILNPEYVKMVAKEQQVLNYLLSSLSHEMLLQVVVFDTLAEVWTYITSSFESQSRARVINMRSALSMTKKSDITISKYVAKMKALTDEMTPVGKRLDDEDLISYILAGMDSDFDPIISAIAARVEPIVVTKLYGELLSHEQRWELQQTNEYHAANAATRGGRGGFGRGRGHGEPGHDSSGHYNNYSTNPHSNL
jgi:hypothetical protein